MSSNFTLRFLRKNGEMCIELRGDLDGSTAHVLVDALKRNAAAGQSIIVDTTGLRSVHPFGQEIFHTILPRVGCTAIRFTGPYGKDLSGFKSQ